MLPEQRLRLLSWDSACKGRGSQGPGTTLHTEYNHPAQSRVRTVTEPLAWLSSPSSRFQSMRSSQEQTSRRGPAQSPKAGGSQPGSPEPRWLASLYVPRVLDPSPNVTRGAGCPLPFVTEETEARRTVGRGAGLRPQAASPGPWRRGWSLACCPHLLPTTVPLSCVWSVRPVLSVPHPASQCPAWAAGSPPRQEAGPRSTF